LDQEIVVKVHCISHTYQDKTEIKICGLDFLVGKGEKIAILGPNGCGKTTLLKHILGILVPKEGEVEVFGLNPAKEFEKMRKRIGVVLQELDEQDEPFSNLDPKSEEEIIQILKEINLSRKTTLITALHDVELVAEIADILYLMNSKGELSEKGESMEILKNTQLLERYNLKRKVVA